MLSHLWILALVRRLNVAASRAEPLAALAPQEATGRGATPEVMVVRHAGSEGSVRRAVHEIAALAPARCGARRLTSEEARRRRESSSAQLRKKPPPWDPNVATWGRLSTR